MPNKPYWVADPRSKGHDVRTLAEAREKAVAVTLETGRGVGIYHDHEMIGWTIYGNGIVTRSWELEAVATPGKP